MAKKLPLLDSGWLTMETPETAMHVGGLLLFRLPDNAPDDFVHQLAEAQMGFERAGRPFNYKLRWRLPLHLDAAWVEDENFDIEYHLRISALPRPGRVRELLTLVSRLHQARLDLRRPPWECYLIEGLEDRRFAIYFKVHHALLDGVAASRLMQSRLAKFADEKQPPIFSAEWDEPRVNRTKPEVRSSLLAFLRSYRGGAAQWIGDLRARRRHLNELPRHAPSTLLNRRVTPARRFAAQSWSIERIHAVAKAFGATLNDVFLTMCSGCLREYLLGHDALPAEPLVAYVPVSVRAADQQDEGGNAISAVQVSLATELADPVERLCAIMNSMNRAKSQLAAMGRAEINAYTTFSNLPLLVGQMTGLAGRRDVAFNLVISNVPGPRKTLHLGGAELLANYPASLIWHGYALNITVQSYKDHFDVGLTACRDTVPQVQRMLGHLEDALAALEASVPAGTPAKVKRVRARRQ